MGDIKERIIALLLGFQNKERTKLYQGVSLFVGVIIFLVILPMLLICFGRWFDENFVIRKLISLMALGIGSAILLWAAYTQWTVGKGTPVPNAPAQVLVVSGPYAYTRNPMELGAIIFYFGLGTMLYSYTVGIIAFLLGLVIGSAYHKCIEEKLLEKHFGQAYLDYKEKVPFLFPRFKAD